MTGRLASLAMALSLTIGMVGFASAPAQAAARTPEQECATVGAKLPHRAHVGQQVQGSYGVINCNKHHRERLRVSWRMGSRCGFHEHGSDTYVVPVNTGIAQNLYFRPTCASLYPHGEGAPRGLSAGHCSSTDEGDGGHRLTGLARRRSCS
jgi:hypothetical protein